MKAQILKNMVVDGRLIEAGTILDVKGWKHAKALNRSRYIKILDEETVKAPQVQTPKVEPVESEEVKPKAKKEKLATE
jgi:hypothetical protein